MKKIILIPFLFITLLWACKPQVSLSGATIPLEAKTVSVGFFTNNTSLGAPSLSQRFSERLRDAVSQQTRLALVKQNGDLQFEGSITGYVVVPVAVAQDAATLNRLSITVNVKYTNKFEASKSFDQSFTRFADFPSNESITSREPDLVQEIYRQITEDVFNKAFNNW